MPARVKPLKLSFKVYFPKFVTINNPRLGILYWVVMVVTVGIAVYQFLADARYEIEKLPVGDAQACAALCQSTQNELNTLINDADKSFCNNAEYNHNWNGESYNNIGCVKGCGQSGSAPCVTPGEANQVGPAGVFIPTFLKETQYNGASETTSYNFVPGAESQRVTFEHAFKVPKPRSSIFGSSPDEVGDSTDDMETIVLNANGAELQKISGGETISFTIQELLTDAWLDDIGKAESQGSLNLNEKYTFEAEGVTGNPSLRFTGLSIVFDIYYTNSGTCQLNLQTDPISSTSERLGCIVPKISRKWTQKTSTSFINAYGASLQRTYHGIDISFHVEGSFKFLDASKVFKGLTTILIWAQIPIWILYYFSIIFLGQLSAIYNRVIHQDMSLKDAIVGLAARLISHSSAYTDVQDTAEGITKRRVLERFSMIMQFNEDLDDAEVANFVDFVYEALATAGDSKDDAPEEDTSDSISCQDFCAACSSNEPLTFDALVDIFDQQREIPFFEGMFNDSVCSKIRHVGGQKDLIDRANNAGYKHAGNRASTTTSKHLLDIPSRFDEISRQTSETEIQCTKLIKKYNSLLSYVQEAEKECQKVNPSALT